MDQLIEAWTGLGAWRWLAIAALLFAGELVTGTAYLLWLSAAAVLTAFVVALPGDINFSIELILFGIFAIASTLVGRKFFPPGMFKSDQPLLNEPTRQYVGSKVLAVSDFVGEEGRVSLGDTQWSAKSMDGNNPRKGEVLEVVEMDGTVLKVVAEPKQQ